MERRGLSGNGGMPGDIPRPHGAAFRIRGPAAALVYQSLAPEIPDEVNPRARTSCHIDAGGDFVLEVSAADIPALRASLNMLLRLIAVAEEMAELAQEGEETR